MVTTVWDPVTKEDPIWDQLSETDAIWDTHGVSCVRVGYGMGSYGDYPGNYGYGCGGLSCTDNPIWDAVAETTISAWDIVAKETTTWDEV